MQTRRQFLQSLGAGLALAATSPAALQKALEPLNLNEQLEALQGLPEGDPIVGSWVIIGLGVKMEVRQVLSVDAAKRSIAVAGCKHIHPRRPPPVVQLAQRCHTWNGMAEGDMIPARRLPVSVQNISYSAERITGRIVFPLP